jgi:hypothetical protein
MTTTNAKTMKTTTTTKLIALQGPNGWYVANEDGLYAAPPSGGSMSETQARQAAQCARQTLAAVRADRAMARRFLALPAACRPVARWYDELAATPAALAAVRRFADGDILPRGVRIGADRAGWRDGAILCCEIRV